MCDKVCSGACGKDGRKHLVSIETVIDVDQSERHTDRNDQ
jgi:hypothetical protein